MSLAEILLDLIFPPRCPFCRRLLEQPRAPVCPACRWELPWLSGEPARRQVEFAELCVSPLAYQGAVADSIRRFKFHNFPSYARPYGLLLAHCVRLELDPPPQLVTWAPLSARRLRKRGYDQAELLARAAARSLDLPLRPTLRKIRHTPAQSSLENPAQRRANALGAYDLLPGTRLDGSRVLLVDDVVTSGATLGECARLLRGAGAQAVYCATLAQARHH